MSQKFASTGRCKLRLIDFILLFWSIAYFSPLSINLTEYLT